MLIQIEQLHKVYTVGSEEVHALRGVDLNLEKNEYLAIMGPSGSGKSTLMNLIGCLDTATKGKYRLNNKEASTLDDNELARIRNAEIGFIFQTFNLMPRSTALQNVELPLIYANVSARKRKRMAREALIQETKARYPDWYLASEPDLDQQELEEALAELNTDGTFWGSFKSVFSFFDILWLFLGASTAYGTAFKYGAPQ